MSRHQNHSTESLLQSTHKIMYKNSEYPPSIRSHNKIHVRLPKCALNQLVVTARQVTSIQINDRYYGAILLIAPNKKEPPVLTTPHVCFELNQVQCEPKARTYSSSLSCTPSAPFSCSTSPAGICCSSPPLEPLLKPLSVSIRSIPVSAFTVSGSWLTMSVT